MMNKKVGFVILNLVGGGAEKVVVNIVELLQKEKVEVHLFLLENKIEHDISNIQNLHIVNTPYKKKKLFKKIYFAKVAQSLKKSIISQEKDQKFDAIFSNLPACDNIVSKMDLDRKIFYIIHTVYSIEFANLKQMSIRRSIMRKIFYKRLYKNKDLIAISKGIYNDFDKFGINYKSKQLIYNPFDIDNIKSKSNITVDDIPNEDYIVMVAAFRKEKRHDIALQAYAKLTNPPKLLLLCNKNKKLEDMINSLSLTNKVKIIGFKNNPYPYIKNAKLSILTSEYEGLPTVIIESLILGTPVVSTDCPTGPREILVDELSSYLAKVNDIDDISHKISLALDNYPKISDKYIAKFKSDNIIKQYKELL